MPGPFLFSTNPLIKFEIQRDFFGHSHFVWCVDCYDGRRQLLHAGARVPPSSNPAELFSALRAATIDRADWHDKNIRDWKESVKIQAIKATADGKLNKQGEQDIIYLIDHAPITQWRPLLYVINRAAVEPKLKQVPLAERASPAMEYRIIDLRPHEFDVLEF